MSAFDSLVIQCDECGELVDFQSKAGACEMRDYTLINVPPHIAADLLNESRVCECGNIIRLRGAVMLYDKQTKPKLRKPR